MVGSIYSEHCYLNHFVKQLTYYHRNLDVKKLVEDKFTYLPHNMNMTRAKKYYALLSETFVSGFRLMCEEDVEDIYILLNNLEKKYNIHGYYSKEEVSHLSYIKTDYNNKVTYFFSFYNL